MDALATVFDYEARYGEAEDPARLAVLLDDAAAMVRSQPGYRLDESDRLAADNFTRVVCAVVNRALSAGELAGFSNYTQSGVDYSASVTVSNPAGDMYLTAAEKRSLGIGTGRVGATCQCGGGL